MTIDENLIKMVFVYEAIFQENPFYDFELVANSWKW